MRRARLSVQALRSWADLNGVELNGIDIIDLQNGKGAGMVASCDAEDENVVFVRVPSDLVLSKELVWEYARVDPHLRQVLEAMGDWTKTAQGAIILFLLVQITASCPDVTDRIGLPNPFTDYVKFLPDERGLPSRWTEQELECLWGTSLQNHMAVKLRSLQTIFDELQEKTKTIPWCAKWWWDEETGVLTFEDFKEVDSMFRSRAMDFGALGESLVPVLDMANHDHADHYVALYEIDKITRGATLGLQAGRYVKRGYEVTINYGTDRSASDLLHAYGFIEDMPNAGSIFVSFPQDFGPFQEDPLAEAKRVGLKLVPGVKFYILSSDRVKFHSPFVYAMSVNEEDGLTWDVARTVDGEVEFQFLFHNVPVEDADDLQRRLEDDVLWDLFQWRAYAYLTMLLEGILREIHQLERRPRSEKLPEGISRDSPIWQTSQKLRRLEYTLLRAVEADFERRLDHLQNSDTVIRWSRGELGPSGGAAIEPLKCDDQEQDAGIQDAADHEPTAVQQAAAAERWDAVLPSHTPSSPKDTAAHPAPAPVLLAESTAPMSSAAPPTMPPVVSPLDGTAADPSHPPSDLPRVPSPPAHGVEKRKATADEPAQPGITPERSTADGPLQYLGRMRFPEAERHEVQMRLLAVETREAVQLSAQSGANTEGSGSGPDASREIEDEDEEDDFS